MSYELYASFGTMVIGLAVLLLPRPPKGGSHWRRDVQVAAGMSLGVVGLGLLALYINGFVYF